MEFLNISFESFTHLPDKDKELYQAAGYLLPASDWGVGSFWGVEWGRVKESQYKFTHDVRTYYDMLYGLACILTSDDNKDDKILEIGQRKWYDVWKFYNFVIRSLNEITEIEAKTLSSDDLTQNEEDIFEPLQKFAHFGTLHGLLKGEMWKAKKVEVMPYEFVYTWLLYEKTYGKAEKKYMDYLNSKNRV